MVGSQEILLEPGQFVMGRKSAAEATGLSEQEVRSATATLVGSRNLTIKTTNKFSIITIINWEIYQSHQNENNQQINQQITNKQPTNNQQITTNKNIKNIKNKYSSDFLDFYEAYPRKVGKDAAWKVWNRRNGGMPSVQELKDAIKAQDEWRKGARFGEFRPEWKHPATWLNGGCWQDEVCATNETDSPFEKNFT
jgi:hypothetical protein